MTENISFVLKSMNQYRKFREENTMLQYGISTVLYETDWI